MNMKQRIENLFILVLSGVYIGTALYTAVTRGEEGALAAGAMTAVIIIQLFKLLKGRIRNV